MIEANNPSSIELIVDSSSLLATRGLIDHVVALVSLMRQRGLDAHIVIMQETAAELLLTLTPEVIDIPPLHHGEQRRPIEWRVGNDRKRVDRGEEPYLKIPSTSELDTYVTAVRKMIEKEVLPTIKTPDEIPLHDRVVTRALDIKNALGFKAHRIEDVDITNLKDPHVLQAWYIEPSVKKLGQKNSDVISLREHLGDRAIVAHTEHRAGSNIATIVIAEDRQLRTDIASGYVLTLNGLAKALDALPPKVAYQRRNNIADLRRQEAGKSTEAQDELRGDNTARWPETFQGLLSSIMRQDPEEKKGNNKPRFENKAGEKSEGGRAGKFSQKRKQQRRNELNRRGWEEDDLSDYRGR